MFLLAFCTFIAGWSKYESSQFSEKLAALKDTLPAAYVSRSTYDLDCARMDKQVDKIDRTLELVGEKLDSINRTIMRFHVPREREN